MRLLDVTIDKSGAGTNPPSLERGWNNMKRFFVDPSISLSLTYAGKVYAVWQNSAEKEYDLGIYTLKYQTSSRAKADAVREYLALQAEQDDIDQYRSDDIKGTIIPSSIKP